MNAIVYIRICININLCLLFFPLVANAVARFNISAKYGLVGVCGTGDRIIVVKAASGELVWTHNVHASRRAANSEHMTNDIKFHRPPQLAHNLLHYKIDKEREQRNAAAQRQQQSEAGEARGSVANVCDDDDDDDDDDWATSSDEWSDGGHTSGANDERSRENQSYLLPNSTSCEQVRRKK